MHAERYATLLHFVLTSLGGKAWSMEGDLADVAARLDKFSQGPGVYSLWIRTSGDAETYVPTYFGQTSRSFGKRFYEHCQARNGKLRELYAGLRSGEITAGGVGMLTIPLDRSAARAMESVFLQAFDFAQNCADNTQSRALEPWLEDADFSRDPELPSDAAEIEAFNAIMREIAAQIDILTSMGATLRALSV